MTRIIQDQNLQLWEAYASSGDSGSPRHARLMFHCLTDQARKARFVEREGRKAEVEKEVATLSDARLADILARTDELK